MFQRSLEFLGEYNNNKNTDFRNGKRVQQRRASDFDVGGLDVFMWTTELSKCGLSYAVVAAMGPQSSGVCHLNFFFISFIYIISMQDLDKLLNLTQFPKFVPFGQIQTQFHHDLIIIIIILKDQNMFNFYLNLT